MACLSHTYHNILIYTSCHDEPSICDSLIGLLRRKLSDGFRQIGQDMIVTHAAVEEQEPDLKKLFFYFRGADNIYNLIYKGLVNEKMNAEEVMKFIVQNLRKLGVDVPRESLKLFVNCAKYLVFLEGPDVPEDTSPIIDHLHPAQEYVHPSHTWYEFVFNLDQKFLSDWIVQKDISRYEKNILSIADTSIKTYREITEKQQKITAVGIAIQNVSKEIDQLQRYERQVYSIIVPLCKDVQASVDEAREKLEGKSSAGLVVSQWQIQSSLTGIARHIKEMTDGFEVQSKIMEIFYKVSEGIDVMVELYRIMDEYQYKIGLGRFIANINAHPAKPVVTGNNDVDEAVNDLMHAIQNNVVMQHYKVATGAVKRNVFPFARAFFGYYDLPKNLTTNNDTNETASYVSNQLGQLKNELLKSNSVIYEHDQFVHQNIVFDGTEGQSEPFYAWKHDEHRINIEKLLHGQKVTLKADIEHGFEGNAVKFNKIGIDFASPNKTVQLKLRESLRGFSVTLIHLGRSLYRCDDRVYTIPSASETIKYSMAEHRESHAPATTNMIYDKIAVNKPVLSPYATWQMQLNHPRNHFHELSKYSSEMVDLLLVGTGQYVDSKLPEWCNEQLDQYYVRANN
ncbi:unnamed protein product [Trichogramma brassicae]|uniref:Uncharacterized protein n=1 Tax=Trichogramma brassicae TaxID=86971 RepID=A0A6H5I926_9HYME|nr:unnamed protein product [Trichogramma brassicae]